jgi:hypothetical protein
MTPEVFGNLQGVHHAEPMADKLQYQRVVGSLLHLALASGAVHSDGHCTACGCPGSILISA